jgi:dipeptidyl aminopeptidase/acylaminoacyl peptidase
MIRRRSILTALVLIVFFCAGPLTGLASIQNSTAQTRVLSISSWLGTGALASPLPAYAEAKGRPFGLSDLLKVEPIDVDSLRPGKSHPVVWLEGTAVPWGEVSSGDRGIEIAADGPGAKTAYLAVYLSASRWVHARGNFQSSYPFQAYLDGRIIAAKTRADKPENNTVADSGVPADLKLETGRHLLVVKSVCDGSAGSSWLVKGSLEVSDRLAPEALTVSADAPEDHMSIKKLLDGTKPVAVSVSPDGAYVALSLRRSLPPSDDSENWVEVRRWDDGRLIRTLRGPGTNGSIQWTGAGHRYSTTTYDKSGATIWLGDIDDGSLEPILSKIQGLGSQAWARDGSFLVYGISEETDSDIEGVKKLRGLEDRQPGFRSRSSLYRLTVPGGVRERLTAGELSTDLFGVSPDKGRLLVGRTVMNYKARPYTQTELSVLDLKTLEVSLLWKGSWLTDAEWSPDGKSILLLGGPSMFGDLGVKVPRGIVPNDYDIQAYLLNLETRQAVPLTRDLDPSVDQAFWGPTGDLIYFLTTDRTGRHLYRYSTLGKAFTLVPCGADVVQQMTLARLVPAAAAIASEPNNPAKAYLIDLETGATRLLQDPGAQDMSDVGFGRVEPWSFKNKRGQVIEGSVYYPPGFDPARKYPCIVNYYGGTTPISADFGGRYPKELYAAQGYVVYVLQPSGAIGYGQNFSALHVNDWGMIVADEIIDGVKKFLAEHAFVDSHRVGCIGASYGGFMTELLLTRTNIFAAAVSHAGISSISGYWGEGYWGYTYSAVATANSFPWNRPDIYINQSPLFSADKITTPLLLLHGASDTNVPPGESAQLYTALKLLGREVELVQVLDQDHLIMTYNKRIIWMKTILSWFDRWLKGQSEWWNDLYPQK